MYWYEEVIKKRITFQKHNLWYILKHEAQIHDNIKSVWHNRYLSKINYTKNEVITRNYLFKKFLEWTWYKSYGRSGDINHGSLDSQIMKKYHVDIVIKTISFSFFLVIRGRIWYKRSTKNLIWHYDKYTSWHVSCINVIFDSDLYIDIVWVQDELDPYTRHCELKVAIDHLQ